MKQPRHQRVPGNVLGYARSDFGRSVARKFFWLGEIPQPNGMDDQEEQSCDHRDPDQEPGNMDRDTLPPRTRRPLLRSPCCLLDSYSSSNDGALHQISHQRDLVGVELQRDRSLHGQSSRPFHPLPRSAGLPRTASSTAFKRNGRAAAPFTAMRMRSIVSPDVTMAEATFRSGKSQTLRSRTFSK